MAPQEKLRHYVTGAIERGEAEAITEVRSHMADTYISIAGGYSYAPLRVGLVVRNPAGQEIYVQPGDDETAMRDIFEALDEIVDDHKQAMLADMALSEYFS